MTFSTNVPNAAQSPGIFPGQNQTNNTRVKTLMAADHVFNDTAASNDGYHKVVHLTTQLGVFGDNTPTPITGVGQLYTKTVSTTGTAGSSSEHLIYHQGTNGAALNETCLSAFPLRAACLFDGALAGTNVPILGFNVTNVTRTASGSYTINFSNNMPSDNYVVSLSALRADGLLACVQVVSVAVGSFQITVRNSLNQLTNLQRIHVLVFGG